MPEKLLERMKHELAEWRGRADELRLKSDLAGMELRDQLDAFRRAYWRAKGRLDVIGELQAERWSAACEALERGWDELRDSYRKARERLREDRD